jgi:DNA-binding NtrC family response regulator
MSILILDDDGEYLRYLELILSQEGHRPLLAGTGLAARRMVEEGGISLILADLHLPDIPGFEVIKRAREVDPLTVCVAMTADISEDSAVEALRMGAYDYLFKPSGADVIKAVVRRGLEHHELRKALIERTAQMESLKARSTETVELMGRLSHRLRNPLTVVYSCAALLTESDPAALDQANLRKGLEMIKSNAAQMRQILAETNPSDVN